MLYSWQVNVGVRINFYFLVIYRTLPFLDYDLVQQNPKFIVGYSDATAMQLGIYTKTGVPSLTGFNWG